MLARLPSIEIHLIATPQLALEAAAKLPTKRGISTHILGDAIEGKARDVGIPIRTAKKIPRFLPTEYQKEPV